MFREKIIFLAFAALILCGGCGLTEGVLQKDPRSYLVFTGDTRDATVYIDDLAPVDLDGSQAHYEVSPGKHTVLIKKSGEEVVNRTVLLGSGITKEIQVP
jgi:hypothetical protein